MPENQTLPEQVTPIDKSAEGVVLPRFVRLMHLYVLSALGTKNWNGIWETFEVDGIGSKQPKWKVRLVITWEGCRPLGTIETLPEVMIETFGRWVDRAGLRGKPNK
jgi:hypothetical protein